MASTIVARATASSLMDWTIGNIFTFAATAGVISAIVNQLLTGWREWWLARSKNKAHAGYHALRLAVLLEAYASACASFIADNGNAEHPPDEQYPNWKVKLPELPPYPDDPEGWKAINLKLATRALNLRNRIEESRGVISSTIEYAMEDLGEELDQQAAARGLEAWELAVSLRRRYGLDPVELIWDFIETMTIAHQAAIDAKKENSERSAALFKQLDASPNDPPPP